MDVKEFLTQQRVRFTTTPHAKAFTAQEVAAVEHVPGSQMAKPVIVRAADGKCVMLVCPASHRVDLAKAAEALGQKVELAKESEMREVFPDVEVGAEPPFGSQYGMVTLVDESLAGQQQITFRAGRHTETVTMDWADYQRLEKPRVVPIARHV